MTDTLPSAFRFTAGAPIQLAAAAGDASDSPAPPRQFHMLAFTGAPVDTMFGTLAIDLQGIEFAQRVPIFRQHDPKMVAGQATKVELTSRGLELAGELFPTAAGREISEETPGFAWQASVGLNFSDLAEVPEGDAATVNGVELQGPFLHVTKSKLMESSFVPLGADSRTSAVALSDCAEITIRRDTRMDPVAQRLEEFRAAFPNDPEFVLEHVTAGTELSEARRLHAEAAAAAHAATIEELRAELEAARKQTHPPVSRGGSGGGSNTPAPSFLDRVATLQAAGLKRADAIRNVALNHPDLHLEYLQSVNPGAPVPAILQRSK